jgi:hypothetical protein
MMKMDNQSKLSEVYIIESNMDISNDEDGQSKGVTDGNQWGKNKDVTKLTNIATTLQNESEPTQAYPCSQQHNTMSMNLYMNMLQHEYTSQVKPTWKLELSALLTLPKN